MDVDVVLGSPDDRTRLAARAALSPHAVVSASPLAAIERVLQLLGPAAKLGRLRVFDFLSRPTGTAMPASQLARLRGRFDPTGRVEILAAPASPAEPAPGADAPTAPAGFGDVRRSGFNFGGGFGGALTATTLNTAHLSSLLAVPVDLRTL